MSTLPRRFTVRRAKDGLVVAYSIDINRVQEYVNDPCHVCFEEVPVKTETFTVTKKRVI